MTNIIIELDDQQANLVSKILQEWCTRFDKNITDEWKIGTTLVQVPMVQDVVDAINNEGDIDEQEDGSFERKRRG